MKPAPLTVTMKSADMDLKPFMNPVVVLIPLLLPTEFFKVMNTCPGAGYTVTTFAAIKREE